MIDITNLEKKFSSDFTLKIDELHIDDGERVALVGMNGSGKSTLLKILKGEVKPDSGSVIINAAINEIGYEPQEPYCFARSVEKNILLGDAAGQDITPLIESCGLVQLRKKHALRLSGGEKQRMCFARMLAGKYRCLLLDEPLSAADIEMADTMQKLLIDYCKKNGTTLLVSTHLPKQAIELSTKILILNHGEIAEYSDTAEVLKAPRSEFGKKFIDRWRIE